MQQRDGSFQGAGNHSVYYQYWTPDEVPRGVILLVHGAGEHSSRYRHFAEYFCGAGMVVAGLDHIGHGKSDGTYGHMESFDDHLQTLELFRLRTREEFPDLPMILLGHSMGGLISACFLLQYQSHFAGCALSGAAIKTDLEPGFIQTWLIRLLSKLAPRLGVLQLDAAGVSRDPAVVKEYSEDPLVNHGKMSARFVSELFYAMHLVQDQARQIELPLLVMHGEGDTMTAPSGSQFLYDNVGSQDKTLKIYPALYHEIFNEPEREQVFADLLAWIEERLETPAP